MGEAAPRFGSAGAPSAVTVTSIALSMRVASCGVGICPSWVWVEASSSNNGASTSSWSGRASRRGGSLMT